NGGLVRQKQPPLPGGVRLVEAGRRLRRGLICSDVNAGRRNTAILTHRKGFIAMSVLSADDLEFFDRNGYVVVHNVVPQENLDALLAVIWTFLEMDPSDPDPWSPPERKSPLVFLPQHQTLWDTRQSPRLYQAFTDLLGTEKLWVSMDRASMKPPLDSRFPHYNDH